MKFRFVRLHCTDGMTFTVPVSKIEHIETGMDRTIWVCLTNGTMIKCTDVAWKIWRRING